MNGASREALAAARERLDALTDNTSVDAAKLAESWPRSPRCSTAKYPCAGFSPTRPRAARARPSWPRACSADRSAARPSTWSPDSVRSRWSQSRDLVDSVEELANTADLTAAQRGGGLDDVEDELFRFGRIVGSDPELRSALTSRTATASAKGELLRSLLGGKAQPVTERIIVRLVTHPRGRSLEAGLDSLSQARRGAPGPHGRRRHLGGAAQRPAEAAPRRRSGELYGREMHLNLDVDPSVLGGSLGACR